MSVYFYSAAFWKSLSLVIAVLVASYTDYKIEAAVLEGLIFAVLLLFDVKPELRAKGLIR